MPGQGGGDAVSQMGRKACPGLHRRSQRLRIGRRVAECHDDPARDRPTDEFQGPRPLRRECHQYDAPPGFFLPMLKHAPSPGRGRAPGDGLPGSRPGG